MKLNKLILATFICTMTNSICFAGEQVLVPRKKVAVVLSGGGAKGMAHIGILKVLERAGIPIDIVTGTSMGSIVGGLYAIGWNANRLDTLARGQNWGFLLSDRDSYYSQNLLDRKRQNTYFITRQKSIGKKDISETGGLINGKNLTRLFKQLTAGYNDSVNFKNLPIPFACAATNIVDNTEYDFHSGILAEAMRASMAIPAAFTPIRKGNMILVDGGLRNNYPADVAREMGADYIIGASVQTPTKSADELTNGAAIIGQIIDVNCKNKYDDNIAITDIPICVNTTGYGAASFSNAAIDTLIHRGEEAAMKHWDEIIALKNKLGLPENYKPQILQPNPNATDSLISTGSNYLNDRPSKNMIQGSVGLRFDNEDMVAMQLNGIYCMSRKPFNIEATLRLGKRIMGKVNTTWTFSKHYMLDFDYTYKYNDIDLYERGSRDYNVTYNHHKIGLTLTGLQIKNMSFDVNARWDYYNYHQVLISRNISGSDISGDDAHYFSYHAKLHYNSENDWNFPSRGARFLTEYAYYTDDFTRYKDKTGFSDLHATWRISLPVSNIITIQPMLYGRLLFGSDIPYIYKNVIGGTWFGHYFEQQMPFAGIHNVEMTGNQFVAAQIRGQLQLTTNNFVICQFASAQQADKLKDIMKGRTILGYQLGYYYRTIFGPIGATVNYNSKQEEASLFINFGFEF